VFLVRSAALRELPAATAADARSFPLAYDDVFIESLAFELPPHRVESAALEAELAPAYERLGVPKGCLETLTGIRARRLWSEGETIASAAARAAERALSTTPHLTHRVGMLVSTSVCKDYLEPSVAALVHGKLRLPVTVKSLDVGNACLGFMTAMELCAALIQARQLDAALLVDAESSRHVVRRTIERLNAPAATMRDFKEALATLTLGSGAVAMVLAHRRLATTTHQLKGSVSRADPENSEICLGTSEWMRTDAGRLLTVGVELARKTWVQAGDALGFRDAPPAHLICHQVGAAHMAALVKSLELDLSRALLTYPELGNVGPAAVPITLGLARDEGRLQQGDSVALMGIGSGLSCAMMSVRW